MHHGELYLNLCHPLLPVMGMRYRQLEGATHGLLPDIVPNIAGIVHYPASLIGPDQNLQCVIPSRQDIVDVRFPVTYNRSHYGAADEAP